MHLFVLLCELYKQE